MCNRQLLNLDFATRGRDAKNDSKQQRSVPTPHLAAQACVPPNVSGPIRGLVGFCVCRYCLLVIMIMSFLMLTCYLMCSSGEFEYNRFDCQ